MQSITSPRTEPTSVSTSDITGKIYRLDIDTGQWLYTGNMDKLEFTYKVPVVAYDRVHVENYQNKHFDILFLKTTKKTDDLEYADVVAAVRCINADQLKAMLSTINDTLKIETDREP